MLPVWAPFIIFDGLQIVLVYTLRSLGDQVVAGINSIIAYFLVTGGLGWALVHHGAGPMGLVYASGAGMLVAALLNGSRFWRLSRRFHRRSRSEEHTSELQSLMRISYAVFCLKQKTNTTDTSFAKVQETDSIS